MTASAPPAHVGPSDTRRTAPEWAYRFPSSTQRRAETQLRSRRDQDEGNPPPTFPPAETRGSKLHRNPNSARRSAVGCSEAALRSAPAPCSFLRLTDIQS